MFEKFRTNKKAKADEKKAKKIAVTADTLESANERRVEAMHLNEEKTQKLETEQWHERYLDKQSLNATVTNMRVNLFIKRDELCNIVVRANKRHELIKEQSNHENDALYSRKIKECETQAKEAYYVLMVVMEWITKIDHIENDYEWQMIMKDLTKNYELMHTISDDTGLLAKIAFFINNFRLTSKGKISFEDMEEKYRKDINEVIDYVKSDDEMKKFDINKYISDYVYTLKEPDKVYESIEWGLCLITANDGKKQNSYTDQPDSSGITEKNNDVSGSNSGMAESTTEDKNVPQEEKEIPQKNEEVSAYTEENSKREVIPVESKFNTDFN